MVEYTTRLVRKVPLQLTTPVEKGKRIVLTVSPNRLHAHAISTAARVVFGVAAVIMAGEGGVSSARGVGRTYSFRSSVLDQRPEHGRPGRVAPEPCFDERSWRRRRVYATQRSAGERVPLRAGRIINIGSPSGRAVKLLGVDNRDTLLIQATAQKQATLYFTADTRRKNRSWVRLHSGVPGYKVAAAGQIAMNGDVVGTLRSLRSSRRVAAIWLPRPTGQYARATMLPPSPTYHDSDASRHLGTIHQDHSRRSQLQGTWWQWPHHSMEQPSGCGI